MAAILAAAGEPGHRHATRHAQIMIHEISFAHRHSKITDLRIRMENSEVRCSPLQSNLKMQAIHIINVCLLDCQRGSCGMLGRRYAQRKRQATQADAA